MKTTRRTLVNAALALGLLLGTSLTSGCGILVDAALDAAFAPVTHDDDCDHECHHERRERTRVIVIEERHERHP